MIKVYSHIGINPYTGFIYLWKNTKDKTFYLGSHHGPIDDNYKGSGQYFKSAYKKHKKHFKRRILEYVLGDVEDLRKREESWLALISDEELGSKYYNLTKNAQGVVERNYKTGLKISETLKKSKRTYSPERLKQLSDQMVGNKLAVGNKITEAHKDAIRKGSKPHTQEAKEKIRLANLGKKYSKELCEKLRYNSLGKKCYNLNGVNKMFFPNTQPDNWTLGRA